jgi:hypothetical protein
MITPTPPKLERRKAKVTDPNAMTVPQLAKRIEFLKLRITRDQKEKAVLAEHLTANINN